MEMPETIQELVRGIREENANKAHGITLHRRRGKETRLETAASPYDLLEKEEAENVLKCWNGFHDGIPYQTFQEFYSKDAFCLSTSLYELGEEKLLDLIADRSFLYLEYNQHMNNVDCPSLYDVCTNPEFYDREEQGIVADYVIIMGYDEHYAGGEPGSVASIEFVKNGIENTLKDVPKEKLVNGVPFYTRLWTETDEGVDSRALGISAAKRWIEENDVELYWQEELGQYYGELPSDEGIQYLWMEEEDSLRQKMDVIKEHDLAGVACWKLGLEDEAAWESIRWD